VVRYPRNRVNSNQGGGITSSHATQAPTPSVLTANPKRIARTTRGMRPHNLVIAESVILSRVLSE
jgi:hypothetical protein